MAGALVTAGVSCAVLEEPRSLGIRHLVVLDITERPRRVISMGDLFDVLVRSQEPMALYARFAEIMLHGGAEVAQSPDERSHP